MHITFRTVKHINIHVFTDTVSIQRTVAIRHNKSGGFRVCIVRCTFRVVIVCITFGNREQFRNIFRRIVRCMSGKRVRGSFRDGIRSGSGGVRRAFLNGNGSGNSDRFRNNSTFHNRSIFRNSGTFRNSCIFCTRPDGNGFRIQVFVKFRFSFREIPHLQKHQGKTFRRRTVYHHSGVLPFSKTFLAVNVLVRQIHPARECRFTVNHQNFPVVTVIVIRGDNRRQRGKCFCLNAVCL